MQGIENYPFNLDITKIDGKKSRPAKLIDIVENDFFNQPIANFLIGEEDRFYNRFFFPYETYDNQKGKADRYLAVYKIAFELRGKIHNGKFSKVYKGHLVHIVYASKWKQQKYREKFRWVKSPTSYDTYIQWMNLEECSFKELEKQERINKFTRRNNLTKEEFHDIMYHGGRVK